MHQNLTPHTWMHLNRHSSGKWVAWVMHMCDITHSYSWHDLFICVTWIILMCDMTHPCMRHDSFSRAVATSVQIGWQKRRRYYYENRNCKCVRWKRVRGMGGRKTDCVYVCVCVSVCVCVCVCVCMCMCVYMCICIHICAYMLICIHKLCMYIQSGKDQQDVLSWYKRAL